MAVGILVVTVLACGLIALVGYNARYHPDVLARALEAHLHTDPRWSAELVTNTASWPGCRRIPGGRPFPPRADGMCYAEDAR